MDCFLLLKRRLKDAKTPFDRMTCIKMLATYYLGMPIAVVMSIIAALLRNGASVCVMAEAVEQAK